MIITLKKLMNDPMKNDKVTIRVTISSRSILFYINNLMIAIDWVSNHDSYTVLFWLQLMSHS